MKRLVHILFTSVLVALLWGCGGGHDARITAVLDRADSLLRTSDTAAHSAALHQMVALDTARALQSDESLRAHHALLLVQARYKCYVTEPADSGLMEIARNYYADHYSSNQDHERYTRALIYSGAVAEELGHPQQAMQYYLEAEDTADPNDHFNLGFTNLRIAGLFHNNLLVDSILIQKYAQAFNHFRACELQHYQLICLTELGVIYSTQNTDSAIYYISYALDLAKRDSDKYFLASNYTSLSGTYFYRGKFDEAKDCALKALNCGYEPTATEIPKCMMLLSRSYAGLGMIDSAQYYARRVSNVQFLGDSVNYYYMMADLNRLDEDSLRYNQNLYLATNAALYVDSISSSLHLHSCQEIYENHKQERILQKEQSKKLFFICLSVLLLIILGIGIWFHRKLMNRRNIAASDTILHLKHELEISVEDLTSEKKRLEQSMRHEITRLNECLMKAQSSINVSNDENESLVKLVKVLDYHLDLANSLISRSYEYEKNPRKFLEEFKKTISQQSDESGFMKSLKSYVSTRYRINLQEMKSKYGLSDDDVNFVCLSCCNVPATVMMVLMGYANTNIVANKRQKLKKKVKAESFGQFIHSLKSSC